MNYYVSRGEKRLGLYDLEQIRLLYGTGQLLPSDLWYDEPSKNWSNLSTLPGLVTPVIPPIGNPVPPKATGSPLVKAFAGVIILFFFLALVGFVLSMGHHSSEAATVDSTPNLIAKYETECGDNTELRNVVNQMMAAGFSDSKIDQVISCVNLHKVCIGMPEKALKLSWGEPDHVNSSTTSEGTTKQLVYGGTYVYTNEDGLITSWQRDN